MMREWGIISYSGGPVLSYGITAPRLTRFRNEGVSVDQAGLEETGRVQLRLHSHLSSAWCFLLPSHVYVCRDIWKRGQGYNIHNS